MNAAEYNDVVLGLIFLKYISDIFEERPRLTPMCAGSSASRLQRQLRMGAALHPPPSDQLAKRMSSFHHGWCIS